LDSFLPKTKLSLTLLRQSWRIMPNAAPCSRRQAAEIRGRTAEASVAAIWQAKGYSILAQRLRTGSGEIDLVVADEGTLIFVEVKSRRSFAEAAYAVLPRQQSRLLQAADSALALHAEWQRPNIRFDVALFCNGVVQHVEDAVRQS
jgi:putative endonuclease